MLLTQKFVNQNTFEEELSCDDSGLARLSYINVFQDSMVNGKICVILICLFLSTASWRVVVIKLKIKNFTF